MQSQERDLSITHCLWISFLFLSVYLTVSNLDIDESRFFVATFLTLSAICSFSIFWTVLLKCVRYKSPRENTFLLSFYSSLTLYIYTWAIPTHITEDALIRGLENIKKEEMLSENIFTSTDIWRALRSVSKSKKSLLKKTDAVLKSKYKKEIESVSLIVRERQEEINGCLLSKNRRKKKCEKIRNEEYEHLTRFAAKIAPATSGNWGSYCEAFKEMYELKKDNADKEEYEACLIKKQLAEEERKRYIATIKIIGEKPTRSSVDGSYRSVKQYLENFSHDPSSIDIRGCSKAKWSQEGWRTSCVYRGKNAYGAKVINKTTFVIKKGVVVNID